MPASERFAAHPRDGSEEIVDAEVVEEPGAEAAPGTLSPGGDGEPAGDLALLAEVRPIEAAPGAALPAVQAAAAAATGFVAGAATLALVRRYGSRRVARAQQQQQRRVLDGLPIVASRSFLVDVHLIGKPQE